MRICIKSERVRESTLTVRVNPFQWLNAGRIWPFPLIDFTSVALELLGYIICAFVWCSNCTATAMHWTFFRLGKVQRKIQLFEFIWEIETQIRTDQCRRCTWKKTYPNKAWWSHNEYKGSTSKCLSSPILSHHTVEMKWIRTIAMRRSNAIDCGNCMR